MFLELLGLGKKCEQRISESLTELFWEFYSLIWVQELPNRIFFGINSVIFLCAMVVEPQFRAYGHLKHKARFSFKIRLFRPGLKFLK